MKKIKWTGWALMSVFLMSISFTSCDDDFDDSALREEMNNLTEKVTQLEKLCQETNTNISSLEALVKAVQEKDYITSVTPVMKGAVEVGFTITFANQDPITIYQGKDGKDGYTPQLTVKMDTDNVYYWQIDGEWLINEGKKLPVTGKDGKDGVTPTFKISEGYWYVSYDKGASWTKAGKASPEQTDYLFHSVEYTTSDVTFTLSDGTQLIVPLKQADITSLFYMGTNEHNIAVVDNETNEQALTVLAFHVAPKEAVQALQDNWSEKVHVKAFYTQKSRVVEFVDMPVKAVEADAAKGILKVTASGENLSGEFFQKKVGGQVIVEIKNNHRVIDSEPVQIESNKPYSNMIKYHSATDIYPDMISSSVWNDYNVSSYAIDDENRWLIFDQELKELPRSAFSNGASYDEIVAMTLPESIERIGNHAFYWCDKLSQIKLPKQLKSIGDGAFSNCEKLTTISLPENLVSIGENAFYYTSLKEVTLPNSLQFIGPSAFASCKKLTNFYGKFASDDHHAIVKEDTLVAFASGSPVTSWTVPATVTYIRPFTFAYCGKLTEIKLQDGLKEIAGSAFIGCKKVTSMEIPNTVTAIGKDAFSFCDSLKYIKLSDSMKEISESLFWCCEGLKEVVIPNSIEQINGVAFAGCSALTSITIPSSVKVIAGNAFQICSALEHVQLAENLREIHRGAFIYCSALKEITIPSTVTFIGSESFNGCSSLASVTVKATTPPEGYDFGIPETATVYVPAASLDAYKANKNWGSYNLQPIAAK